MEKVLLEYGKEAEILEKLDAGYRVRITKDDEVTEKTVGYKPLSLDCWKFNDGDIVQKADGGKFFRVKRYTTYLRDGILIPAYRLIRIDTFEDNMEYENVLEKDYKLIPFKSGPFLSVERIKEMVDQLNEEKLPFEGKIARAEREIAEQKKRIVDLEKTYNIDAHCAHVWDLIDEEELNEGQTTKKSYECVHCGKVDVHHWHKLL